MIRTSYIASHILCNLAELKFVFCHKLEIHEDGFILRGAGLKANIVGSDQSTPH